MDIIPFVYLLLFVCWLSISYYFNNQYWPKSLLQSINFFITVHALYLIYSLSQWFSFIKQLLHVNQPINWDLVFSIPMIQTVGLCFLPLLFFIPFLRANKFISIGIWGFIGWSFYNRFNYYFFSFHKVALCISIFISIGAFFGLLDLYKKRL
jgi:hypothetical protein